MDKIRIIADVGLQVKAIRQATKIRTTLIAEKSGRSRDVLNRLEKGRDVSLKSLLVILAAMDKTIEIVPLGRPTREEMRRRTLREMEDEDDC
jgi:transcriptional regulator with XRE-family HTH domain